MNPMTQVGWMWIAVKIPLEIHAQAQAAAKQQGLSLRAWLRSIVTQAVGRS